MVKKQRKPVTFRELMIYIVLVLLTCLCLFPFFMLMINATRSHTKIQKVHNAGESYRRIFMNLRNVFHNENLPVLRGTLNSLVIAGGSAALAVYFSSLTAYGLHAYDFRGKKQAFSFILLVMLVPSQVSALGFLREMLALGLRDSFLPLILPAVASPTVVFFMKQYMASAVPLELVSAARIDGANEFYAFNRVIIPIMKPAFAVQGIFAFVASWNNYFMPSLLLDSKMKKTLPILIAQLRSADFLKYDLGQVYMLITIAILPTVIVYLLLSKNIVGGIALGGIKG